MITIKIDSARKNITEEITYKTSNEFLKVITIFKNGVLKETKLKSTNDKYAAVILCNDFDPTLIESYDSIYKCILPIKHIQDLNKGKLFFLYTAGHLLFDENMKIVSIPYVFNYIGSLKERFYQDPIFKKLIEKLKKHEYVQNLETSTIPSYNSDFSAQLGIEICKVYVPQKQYEKLFEHYKDNEYFSVRMKEIIACSWNSPEFNLYGKDIHKLLKEYWTTKEY